VIRRIARLHGSSGESQKFFAILGVQMLSDLFAVVSGTSPHAVIDCVPPAARRPPLLAGRVRPDGADVIVDCPVFRPRRPGRHFVPAFSALTTAEYSFRFEAAPGAGTSAETWVGTVSIGGATFDAISERSEALRSEIDVFVASEPLESIRLRLRLRAPDLEAVLGCAWMVTLSVCDGGALESPGPTPEASTTIPVPPLSQLEEDIQLGWRVCSPTSVAMVLRHWGRQVSVSELAAEMYHPARDLYGVWLCAIQAAARRGIPGYLLRFPDWSAAAWCLTRGLPVVASVRYAAGEVTGAAIAQTAGHLLVLTGADDQDVLVNDPAASTRAEVARRYRLDEITRVWLGRSGVGYVFCPPR
jgi:hypothetical protein